MLKLLVSLLKYEQLFVSTSIYVANMLLPAFLPYLSHLFCFIREDFFLIDSEVNDFIYICLGDTIINYIFQYVNFNVNINIYFYR